MLEGGGFDKFGPLNSTESGTKDDGFVWIAPTAHHSCFNCWIWWELVFNDRIMEATLVSPDITF